MIGPVTERPLPDTALPHQWRKHGAYADCFAIDVPGDIELARFVAAFYTSAAFRPERTILAVLLSMPSTDDDARALAAAVTDRFAAWHVEARAHDQIMLCDYQKRTRSWLMVEARGEGGTRLYFGTVVTQPDKAPVKRALAVAVFRSLLWFHKFYSRILLRSAAHHLFV